MFAKWICTRRSIPLVVMVFFLVLWSFTEIFSMSPSKKNHTFSRGVLPKRDEQAKYFVLGRDQDVYMYSAFVHLHGDNKNNNNDTEIVITTLDKSQATLDCCVIYNDMKAVIKAPTTVYFEHGGKSATIYVARQFLCKLQPPSSFFIPSHITLTSTQCSHDLQDYIPIQHPQIAPGGLALCGKIAHNSGLDPENVIEWFEVQRILGVDKILLFNLNNPENLTRVLRYYQNLGILDLQPYELPGFPRNRSLSEKFKRTDQFGHDETLAVLECRLRMAGYDYVMSHDLDEFIIPRRDVNLKEFIKEHLHQNPNAAGFYFHVEFFITTWDPTNPEEDLMVKRYRKSRVPRWECQKYLYLPSRVKTSTTHYFHSIDSKYSGPRISTSDAILHHYRICPEDTWGTCTVETNIDNTMTRYRDLDKRVYEVRKATSTTPRWTPVKH